MTTFAICRIQKLKSGKISAAQKHNRRESEVPNADPGGAHISLLGADSTYQELLDKRIEQTGASMRSDGVPLVEMMLSASPAYFRPSDPDRWGYYESDRLEKWLAKTQSFLEAKYGENLVSIDLHLDESTPHIHAMISPILTKEKAKRRTAAQIKTGQSAERYRASVFDAAGMFDRKALIELQSDYAGCVKALGLERGVRKSRAAHTTLKEHYGRVDETGLAREKAAAAAKKAKLASKVVDLAEKKVKKSLSEMEAREGAVAAREQSVGIDERNLAEIISRGVLEGIERYKLAYGKLKNEFSAYRERNPGKKRTPTQDQYER